jgi:hypothetical protein
MRLYIRLITGRAIQVNVDCEDTIGTIKEEIERKEGIPRDHLRLVFAGRELHDWQTVQDYNLLDDGTIYMVVQCIGKRYTLKFLSNISVAHDSNVWYTCSYKIPGSGEIDFHSLQQQAFNGIPLSKIHAISSSGWDPSAAYEDTLLTIPRAIHKRINKEFKVVQQQCEALPAGIAAATMCQVQAGSGQEIQVAIRYKDSSVQAAQSLFTSFFCAITLDQLKGHHRASLPMELWKLIREYTIPRFLSITIHFRYPVEYPFVPFEFMVTGDMTLGLRWLYLNQDILFDRSSWCPSITTGKVLLENMEVLDSTNPVFSSLQEKISETNS